MCPNLYFGALHLCAFSACVSTNISGLCPFVATGFRN